MILEQSGALAPANEPWTLIRDAIHDLELQEKQEGVDVDMSGWHVPIINGACHQCLARSVMSRHLGIDTDNRADPFDYPDDVAGRLRALNWLSIGEVNVAYRRLKLEFPDTLPERVHIPGYRHSPPAFKSAMLDLADQLESAQPVNQ